MSCSPRFTAGSLKATGRTRCRSEIRPVLATRCYLGSETKVDIGRADGVISGNPARQIRKDPETGNDRTPGDCLIEVLALWSNWRRRSAGLLTSFSAVDSKLGNADPAGFRLRHRGRRGMQHQAFLAHINPRLGVDR